MAEPENPTISVVINVYNEEPRYLAEAIESVQAQTVQPSEILIVEDGARRDYAPLLARYPDVKVIRQANQGLAAARNTGLHAATGEFILFLDGDDRMMPQSLALNLRRFAERPEIAMAYGGYRMIDSEGAPSWQARMPELGADHYATMLEGNCIGMHATVLYRRDALLAIGGFDPDFRACEDYELYLRMARHAPIAAGSEMIAEYRYHGANMSGDRAMMLKTVLRVLDVQDKYVAGHPEWESARARGRATWKSFYARGQLAALQEALAERRQIGRAFSGMINVLALTPVTTVKEATMEILKRLRARWRHGSINFGDLRRTKPIDKHFGVYRGKPVDRHYIEEFLARHASDVRGRVLEIADNAYTFQFGGDRVELSETLHVDPSVKGVTYCSDLTHGEGIPDNRFDCIILTQTLQMIYEARSAIATLHRILKPGGVLLVTAPGVSMADLNEWGDGWLWSFTGASLQRMLEEPFGKQGVQIETYGNVLTAAAFLYGLAEDELRPREFNVCDPRYPVIVAARAVKGQSLATAA